MMPSSDGGSKAGSWADRREIRGRDTQTAARLATFSAALWNGPRAIWEQRAMASDDFPFAEIPDLRRGVA